MNIWPKVDYHTGTIRREDAKLHPETARISTSMLPSSCAKISRNFRLLVRMSGQCDNFPEAMPSNKYESCCGAGLALKLLIDEVVSTGCYFATCHRSILRYKL